MERKIGETFKFEGKKLQVKEDKYRTCNDCFFNIKCTDESLNIGGYCDEDCRKDGKSVIFTEVIEEQKLNLCEILKHCPKGFKLYSAIHGEVTFFSIEDGMYPICVLTNNNNGTEYFSSSGKLYESCGECLLFPSKEQKDWSKFTAPWYKKEKLVELKESDDEKMRNFIINELVCLRATDEKGSDRYEELTNAIAWLEKQGEQNLPSTNERAWLYLVSDVLTWKDGIGQYLDDPRVQELTKRLCSKYAQKLYNSSILSNPSNVEKNKQKFDPKTLKLHDKVLVRDEFTYSWASAYFYHIKEDSDYPYMTTRSAYRYCIPYNNDTKHLDGRKEQAPDFYRYWED